MTRTGISHREPSDISTRSFQSSGLTDDIICSPGKSTTTSDAKQDVLGNVICHLVINGCLDIFHDPICQPNLTVIIGPLGIVVQEINKLLQRDIINPLLLIRQEGPEV